MPDPVPHEIRVLADERARARRARDWATADRIKAELDAAGWRVIDAATLYSLEPKPAALIVVDGEARYGASDVVPSRLEEPETGAVSVVVVSDDRAGLIPRSISALRAASPNAQIIVVADWPSVDVEAEITALEGVEVVRLARWLGAAGARNAGLRRAAGGVVVLLDPGVVVQADAIGRLASALDDATVGVAGLRGLATGDLVHFEAADAGSGEVVALDLTGMAFRRADYSARGPLDEHFTHAAYLDAWWSLVLRDVAEDAVFGVDVPRRALVVDAPFDLVGPAAPGPNERLGKKHRYRFLKWFATRRDLLVGTPA
jgi:glycosyltransferase involved in cell wall biosynthesis